MKGGLEAALSMNQHPRALLDALRGKAKVGGAATGGVFLTFHITTCKCAPGRLPLMSPNTATLRKSYFSLRLQTEPVCGS